jgi:hypothetical protein
MTAPHIPDIVTKADTAGRWRAQCLSCMDGSNPNFHKPIADQWKKTHIAEAVPPNRPRP